MGAGGQDTCHTVQTAEAEAQAGPSGSPDAVWLCGSSEGAGPSSVTSRCPVFEGLVAEDSTKCARDTQAQVMLHVPGRSSPLGSAEAVPHWPQPGLHCLPLRSVEPAAAQWMV